jgi:hypothetical protein
MRILITVTSQVGDTEGRDDRHVFWGGDVGWPSVPSVGARWVHCGGWPGESVAQVAYCGPGDDGEDDPAYIPVQVIVRTTNDVIAHLIERHGFSE